MESERRETPAAISEMIERFKDTVETEGALGEERTEELAALITNQETLKSGLPELLKEKEEYERLVKNADLKVKDAQMVKRAYENRLNGLKSILCRIAKNLGLKSLKANGVSLQTKTGVSLEVDEEWLLGQYQSQADALQRILPQYVKVKLSLDKAVLKTCLKSDDTLIKDNPEKIHNVETVSACISPITQKVLPLSSSGPVTAYARKTA